MDSIKLVDLLLKDENLPAYTEAINALLALTKNASELKGIDQHLIYKSWSILDRWSANIGKNYD